MTALNRQPSSPLSRLPEEGTIAYFSMEIAIRPDMPTYSGGLGVLAGDTLRSAADLALNMTAVTLLHRQGYYSQHLDAEGNQTESAQPWRPEEKLAAEEPRVTIGIEGRPVTIRAWRFDVHGATGHTVPIYMLDTDLEENDPEDRTLTDHLYGGDGNYRLRQEAVLGLGGPRILAALGYEPVVYHMNEGHAALLTVAALERRLEGRSLDTATEEDFATVRERCVFTTHTPVPAGHDRFSREQAERILGVERTNLIYRVGGFHDGLLNMTYVALRFSRFVNGVAMQHGKVSRAMFPEYRISAITNGIHAGTWTSGEIQELFDQRMPRWRQDNVKLRYAIDIDSEQIHQAHQAAKRRLIQEVGERSGLRLDENMFTIGFARRAATYKRADLFFHDPERLVRLAHEHGGLQVLYSGKAHPADQPGKAKIKRVIELARELDSDALKIVYLENYNWELGALLTQGVDLWLNTPKRPYEASGTSGMKAAINGVPSLSILDGWWIEGWIEGVTGWAIEDREDEGGEAASLYEHLEQEILPTYYRDHERWHRIMRSAIALNGSFFNTQRMIEQYLLNAYFPEPLVDISDESLEPALTQ